MPSGLRWCFAPGTEGLQAGVRGIPWAGLASWPAAQRVKVAANRDVWRIDLADKTIYAKCYRSQTVVKRLIEAFRGVAAKREWEALRQASRLGVEAPDPVGYARAVAGYGGEYQAILVTAAMPVDAMTLEEAWLQAAGDGSALGRGRRLRIIEALAELIARAHAGGLFHRDLHVNNILLFKNGHGPAAAMIDLHNARLAGEICSSGVRDNLVQLNQWFARHASQADRLRFLKGYCRYLRMQPAFPERLSARYEHKVLARQVLGQAHRYAAKLYRKRDGRILRRNKYFASLHLPSGWSGRVALEIKHGRPYAHRLDRLPSKVEWTELLRDAAGVLGGESAGVAAGRRFRQVDVPFGGLAWTVVVARQGEASFLGRLAALGGKDSLRREFVAGWKCLHRELPVALPLAIMQRCSESGRESVLVTEQVPDSRDLDTFSRFDLPEMPAERVLSAKRRICQQLAHMLRRMWFCGLWHHDLRAAGIRIQTVGGDSGRLKVVLVDVGGVGVLRWRRGKTLLRALARLDGSLADCRSVTRTDRLRLLLAVLRGMRHGHPDWKGAWRRIARMSPRDQVTAGKAMPWLQSAVGVPAAP